MLAEGEVYLSRHPSCGCRIWPVGQALVTVGYCFFLSHDASDVKHTKKQKFKMQPQPDFSRNNLSWRAWTPSLKLLPSFLKRSMAHNKRQPMQRTSLAASSSRAQWPNRHESNSAREIEQNGSASQDDDDESEWSRVRTCVTRTSLTSGSTTKTHARAAYSRRTTTLPTHKRDSATEPGRASVSVAHVAHSWTLNSSMVRPAAPLKPPGDTLDAFTPSSGDCDSQTQESPRNSEDYRSTIQTSRSFHNRCCPRTQRGSGRVRGLLQCSSSPR